MSDPRPGGSRVAQFYESLGFRHSPDSLLLVQKITDIEAALRKPG